MRKKLFNWYSNVLLSFFKWIKDSFTFKHNQNFIYKNKSGVSVVDSSQVELRKNKV